jgi:hypothetical protein
MSGIDYGHGRTNIDHATGIRYGVISIHAVTQAWCDSSELVYPDPTCPKCGADVRGVIESDDMDALEQFGRGCADYVCEACQLTIDAADCIGDEATGSKLDDGEYEAVDCLDSDIMVLKSPYYTRGVFCSPCVPGAVSLESPDDDGAKAYCFGHDWFEDGAAPYRVYRVSDDSEVLPETDA